MRVLTPHDEADLRALIARNPELNVFVSSRVDAGALRMPARAGEIWGFFNGTELVSALLVGPNIVPVELVQEAAADFGAALSEKKNSYSSLVGPRDAVNLLWSHVQSSLGPARVIRERQPYMKLTRTNDVSVHNQIRLASMAELNSYFEASVDMFKNEVEIDPLSLGANAYRSRVMESIKAKKSFGWFDSQGRTLFKMDIGAVSNDCCQIQGVWLAHELRGQGLAASLIAAAVERAKSDVASNVCLYVNDFNRPAIRAYEKVGFETVGEFSTVFL